MKKLQRFLIKKTSRDFRFCRMSRPATFFKKKAIPPHITVVYPPFISEKKWLPEKEKFATCLRAFEPFKVTIWELGHFKGDSNILWRKPESDESLLRIHSALEERFPEHVPSSRLGYVPHVTVGLFESQEALFQAKETILSKWEILHFVVDEMFYAVLGGDGIWHIEDRLHLKNN
ncbi:2'-5' RNA ligase family protein [Candidatus Aerophobetes bacterium]|uniref:2'-5' RNA ligase family protein n=1 Tax=Aerophobetes bacterium TaxID=2030807 RepID=A0A523S1G8_UNCAE|nr:MAG: 2'-5' RNA ligase family protein [Candidatus Aerophobetes bacterium]